ncbi:Putative magnesium-dependent phosphatase P8B7.31 [Wickerhamiella sorbophila]|uniref:Magnesium-dependent phosphatase P8B7.31 n=1 Tax=Wickerhamiella sorbophila TaxID=45607 RepID=A0A2T0FL46_9ASCO|nr:Putative magnesium-dependent phosphatase P8B7.31 [Wickerhamiella sorbophila]PRT55714.1 Putative magnesium-dependent phosphatase P8B7.31 [Wickerhamiella sorbophila]
MSLPKLIVFDLDYTLWPFWCDTHVSMPVKALNDNQIIVDSQGDCFTFYEEVPMLLKLLNENKNFELCVASRTQTPAVAKALLQNLHVDGQPSEKIFRSVLYGTGSKVTHFEQLKKLTGVDYHEMLFFDDESRNRDVEHKLGVVFCHVENGMTMHLYKQGIELWRKNYQKLAPRLAISQEYPVEADQVQALA